MKHLKLFFACLLMAVLSIGQVWAAETAITVSANPTNSGTFTISAVKSSGTNAPIVTGGYVRCYAKNVITISTSGSANMTGMTIAWTKNGSKTFASVTASTGTYSHPSAAGNGTWSGSAKSVDFTVGASGQIQITSVTITTEDGGGSSDPTLTVEPATIDFGTVDQNAVVANKTVTVSFENLTGSVAYSGLSSPFTATGTISDTGDEITIAANTATAGDYSQTLTVQSAADELSKTVTVKMKVVAPLTPIEGGVVDELIVSDFGVTSGSYTAFTDKQASNEGHSDAVYAGTVARNGNATQYNIQLNSGQTSSKLREIVTSTSGGYAKRVQAIWATQTANVANRKLTVYGSESAYTGSETLATGTNLGDLTYTSGDAYAYLDIDGDYPYIQIVASGAIYMDQINVTWVSTAAAVAAPTISGDEKFLTSTSVSMSCTTAGAEIYYTLDASDPQISGSKQLYSDPFSLTVSGPVNARAKLGDDWSGMVSKTFIKIDPIDVPAAIAAIPNKDDFVNEQFVRGIVCTAAPSLLSGGKLTYYISADGSETNRLQIYKGKNLNNTEFAAVSDLAIGDRVIVFGQLKNYNGTPEMNDGNYLVSKEGPAVAAPVFSPDGGGFMGETDVTISCATASNTIYYTLDGTTPSKSSNVYSEPIHLNATTTITAVAYVGDDASLVIAKTFTLTAPMTVAEALTALDSENPINNVAVAGIISTAPTSNPSSGRLTYYISDDGSDTNELEVYLGFGLNGASFSAKTDLQVGDEVTVFGNLKIHSGSSGDVKEFDAGSRLLAFDRPVVAVSSVSLPATETVEVGSTVTLTATVLPENASDKSILWSVQSGSTYASVADGVVSGLVAGEAVIRATSVADGTKYAECTVTVVAADPTKHVVTFDATVDMGESPLSKSNISMACTSGALNNGSEYRLYKSSTTTFACSVGNITKIEFTGVSGNPVSGFGDPEVGTLVTEGNNGVWTGNAESVSFVASGAQVRATEIVVTYKEDNRAAAGLTWSTDAVELTVGDEFTAPTLNNPNSIAAGEITIASDNTDLAIVTAGVVSLVADATGTATITATFEGNEDYKPAVVSYTITVNEAGLDNVTFDATLDIAGTGELSIAKSGFTLEFTGGALDNGENYRLYKSQTMTLSSSSYLIKKIEFTCTSGNPISGFADAEGLDKANNQWTGEANSVELTASNAQVRIEKLKVYYIEDTRAASGLEWSTDEIEITLGDPFTPANLINPNSIDASAITIESDNTDLAVVNDGVVSLVADATGTAHIKALFAGNETYKPAKISYTIIVNDPTPTIYVDKLNVNFGSVEVGDAVPAAQTITVSLSNVAAVTATLGGTNPEAFSISKTEGIVDDDVITISVLASTAAEASYSATIAISDGEDGAVDKTVNLSFAVTAPASDDDVSGTWTLVTNASALAAGKKVIIAQYVDADGAINTMAEQRSNNRGAVASSVAGSTLSPIIGTKVFTLVDAGDGKIAFKDSENKYLCAASSGSNYLRSQETNDAEGQWIVSIDEDAKATITAQGTFTRNLMRYNPNSGSPIFSCYASSSTTGTLVALYMHEDTPEPPVEDWTDVRTGLTPNHYYTICLEKEMTAIQGATLWSFIGKDASYAYIVQENAPFEAGKPYIMYATASTVQAVLGDETNAPGDNGALHGTFELMNQSALDGAGDNIYLIIDNSLRRVDGQTGNTLPAYRAYVDLDEIDPISTPNPAPGRQVRRMPMQKDQAQGFENIEASEKPMKLMIDGTLYILRGEKMYDATGRLVK